MSEISTDLVRHLAGLARIDLSESELESLTGELAQIVDSIAKVSEVATPDVVATSHPIPLSNVFREDEVRPSLSVDEALRGAPEREGDRFKVASILDEEQ
ncbi:Asp-tRNA(Asn)/Glu-tRNA(Gln) amidotransferase subunit GatC [Gryllotalpicola daejeonensis]|uniref:Aspartyl/glutamyl-tRNA(Asn/Gln) amidotransferase subunit C n=1 Tax=Gryllotalpicola daejeonensis TaxID=993087 RepID=A0ABP7ZG78_9MICO